MMNTFKHVVLLGDVKVFLQRVAEPSESGSGRDVAQLRSFEENCNRWRLEHTRDEFYLVKAGLWMLVKRAYSALAK